MYVGTLEVTFWHVRYHVGTHMVTQERIEWAVQSHPDPVVSVGDIQQAIDEEVSDTHVRQKMDLLAAAGTLGKKKVGARAVAYWHTGRVSPPQTEPAEHPDQAELDDTDEYEPPQEPTGGSQSVDSAMQLVDLPGSGEKEQKRREAFRALLEKLRSEAPEQTNDLYEPTYRDYDTGYNSAGSWRSNAAGPALSTLADHGVVECVDSAAGEWRWTGV